MGKKTYSSKEKVAKAVRRVPPHNYEAEQCVLGSILLQQRTLVKVVEILSPEDFYFESHSLIYSAMVELFKKSKPQDLVTVSNIIMDQNNLEAIGGAAYLASLTDIVPVSANIGHYAEIVSEKSLIRQLISTSSEITSRCYEDQSEVDNMLDEAETSIFKISNSRSSTAYKQVNLFVKDAFQKVVELSEQDKHITGVPTGYEQLDAMTAGLHPSNLIIVAARPSLGKTSLAMNMAQNAAIISKIPVGVFSLEMSGEELSMRMLCSVGRVDLTRVRTGKLRDSDWPKLTRAVGILDKAPIFIDETPAISVLEIRAKARRMKTENNIQLVVVDYLQLMTGSKSIKSRQEEISEISRSLKALAKELNIPVIALSQLSRAPENRTDSRPKLSDLRESGAIEQDADVVCFLYRDEMYDKSLNNPNRGTAELIIGKQRNGPTGTVKLAFIREYTTFEDIAIN